MVKSIEEFQSIISSYSAEEQETILRAAHKSEELHRGQLRESGER